MNRIKEVIRKINELIAAVELQKMAQDSELLKDVYGTILTDTFTRKENY